MSSNTRSLEPAAARRSEIASDEATRRWLTAVDTFLSAVDPLQREVVEGLVNQLHSSGSGLRIWLQSIAWRGAKLPRSIPTELINVYLYDSEAVPLHDCEECGLAVPVRPDRRRASDAAPERVYFPQCPACGGRTGWYFYLSQMAEPERHSGALAKKKPR